jgi:hypothetical protein
MELSNWYGRILVLYVAIAVAFIVEILLNQRGYQDSWILQDIFVPTILYVLTFSVVAVLLDNNKLIALVCASFVILLMAVPNLKYDLFPGTFDSVAHYGYIKNLVSLGHVPSTGSAAPSYEDFPGMHILIGSLSIILSVSINEAIKLVTSMIMGIIPLMAYFATNRIFGPNIQKFIIIASGLPVFTSYALTGTAFAVPLYFCIICLILRSLITRNERQHTIVLLILALGLLFSHAMTTLYLISFLVITFLLLKFLSIKERRVLSARASYQKARVLVIGILIFLIVSFAARLTFGSGNILQTFTNAAKDLLIGHASGLVPGTFFKLPFSAKVVFLALSHTMDAVIALMGCVGAIVLFVKLRYKNREIYEKFYTFLLCFMGAILALLSFQLLSGFSGIEYERLIYYTMVLSPFLVGLLLWHFSHYFSRYRFGSAFVVLVLFSCISVSLIQIFPFQPIVPRANVLSPSLPKNEYIFDYRLVNTVYQENMILFAEGFSSNNTIVASDIVTRWQIGGFANETFANRVIYDSPLIVQNVSWNLFLLHYDGKAGPLNEPVENRTGERLTELKGTLGNVIYDNGQSFIMSR